MARKRKLEQSPTTGPEDISNVSQDAKPSVLSVSRRKKSAATRIGRACDRCQHRKLACDPSPEGCPTCVRVDAWCTATDPLTGNPTYRGEFEYLERTVARQRVQIEHLLARLRLLGEDVGPYQDNDPGTKQYLAWTQVKAVGDTRPWDRDERQPSSQYSTAPQQPLTSNGLYYNTNGATNTDTSLPLNTPSHRALGLPDLRTGLAGENYVGVSANNPSLSSNRGSKLNVLGWEINITGLISDDADDSGHLYDTSYDRSYRSFIASAFGISSKVENVQLPAKEEAFRHALGYLYVLNCFLPILHKPSFMKLLTRFYDDHDFKPTAAEEVMVHIMFASMFYQDANRNWEDPIRQQGLHAASDIHYHFSLGKLADLMAGHTLQDVQALGMLCAHMRTFPKPEASWLVTTMSFSKAIELGLHKAVKPDAASNLQMSILEIEMRKRVFWSIAVIHITISGKLGRPMPIREEDYDVGLPIAVDDDCLTESGLDTTKEGKCAFLAGIEAFKVEPLFMDLYRNFYAAKRSPKDYAQFVANSEKRIQAWRDQWPAEFSENPQLNRIFIQYLHLWMHEFRLLLHHPSLSLTKSVQLNDTNLRTCLSVSQDMLKHVSELQQLKSLDTTWQSCAVYILAIQTTLYAHGQLKSELTLEKVDLVRSDMEQWLSIMGDIGGMLGTGRRFQNAIRKQIDIGLGQLEQQVSSKTAILIPSKSRQSSAAGHSDSHVSQVDLVRRDNFPDTNGYGSYAETGPLNGYDRSNRLAPPAVDDSSHSQNVYTTLAAYAYPEPANGQYATSSTMPPTYAASPYPVNLATQALSTTFQPQLSSGAASSMTGIYAPTANNYQQNNSYGPDSQSWFQYTQTIPSGIGPQDYNPASALLQLGGRTDHVVGRGDAGRGDVVGSYDTSAMSGGAGQMWPFNIVDHQEGA